jgi:hypothetical protein
MPRLLVCLCLFLTASSAFAQSVYVGGAAGANTVFAQKIDFGGTFSPPDTGGTTPVFAIRSGIGLGEIWGAEVEVAHALPLERSTEGGRGQFFPAAVLTIGPGIAFPTLRVESERRSTAVNALGWVRYPVSARVDLVVLAGATFNRSEVEERYTINLPPLFPQLPPGAVVFAPQPASIRTLTYDVGPLVGIEGRIRVGSRFRVVPGLRLSGANAGWSVRPMVGVDWVF